jgi:hypothetical protein
VSFPAQPKIEDIDYKLSDGSSIKSRVYSLELDNKSYRMTVADFSHKNWDEFAVLDQAVKSLLQDADLKLDLRCPFNLIYTCREMSIVRHAAATQRSRRCSISTGSIRSRALSVPPIPIRNRATPSASSTLCVSPISPTNSAHQNRALAHLAM